MIDKMNLKDQVNSVTQLFSYLKVGHVNDHMLNVLQAENRTLDFHAHDNSDGLREHVHGDLPQRFGQIHAAEHPLRPDKTVVWASDMRRLGILSALRHNGGKKNA
jgi:hypothetical protein